jgi:MFS family permease
MSEGDEHSDQVRPPAELSTCDILKEEIFELKWRVLVVACFLTFGSYYIYDFPGSIGTGPTGTIQKWFHQHGKDFTQEMNQALYSVYSWPNTVLAMFGGLLIDKYLGLRRAMLLFTGLVFTGSVLFYVGVVSLQYPVMLFARVVFGLGGESLSVAQSAFVARWFKGGRGMALAFGITISFSRVGSSFNFLFSPMIASSVSVGVAVLCGMVACCVSLTLAP